MCLNEDKLYCFEIQPGFTCTSYDENYDYVYILLTKELRITMI